jgi:hypothetical protein
MERQEFFSKAKNSLACTPDVKVKKVWLSSGWVVRLNSE